MRDFCGSVGSKRELIVPYNPQHNGVAERKNMTIVGRTRGMLLDQSLPFFLWDEACNCCLFVEHAPTQSLGEQDS